MAVCGYLKLVTVVHVPQRTEPPPAGSPAGTQGRVIPEVPEQFIAGDVAGAGHDHWIRIHSYEHSIRYPNSDSVSGTADYGSYAATKDLDVASPVISQACVQGTVFPEVVVELQYPQTVTDAALQEKVYMRYRLRNAVICDVSRSHSGDSGQDRPAEFLSFRYDQIEWEYLSDPGGTPTPTSRISELSEFSSKRTAAYAPVIFVTMVAKRYEPQQTIPPPAGSPGTPPTVIPAVPAEYIEGETRHPTFTKDDGSGNMIPLGVVGALSFSHQLQPPTYGTGVNLATGGGVVLPASHGSVTITKILDRSLPRIAEYCAGGKRLDEVIIELFRSNKDGGLTPYMTYTLYGVKFTRWTPEGLGSNLFSETLSMGYAGIRWEYHPLDSLGSAVAGGGISAEWHDQTGPATAFMAVQFADGSDWASTGWWQSSYPATTPPAPATPGPPPTDRDNRRPWIPIDVERFGVPNTYTQPQPTTAVPTPPAPLITIPPEAWGVITSVKAHVDRDYGGINSSGGPQHTARADHKDLEVTRRTDQISARLFQVCCDGTQLARVVIFDPVMQICFLLEGVHVTSYEFSGSRVFDPFTDPTVTHGRSDSLTLLYTTMSLGTLTAHRGWNTGSHAAVNEGNFPSWPAP